MASMEIVLNEVYNELVQATNKFDKFHSEHEGYAVLLEEVDELWECVRLKQGTLTRKNKIREEAIQVAAMAIRLVMDCCDSN